MAGVKNELLELLLRDVGHYLAHNLPESPFYVHPHSLLAIVVARVGRLEDQHESVPTEPLVVVDVSLDSDRLVGCMIVENNVRSLGLRQIGFCQTVPYYFEEVDHVVLIRRLRKEEDWFGGLVPDSSEHRDVMRSFYRNCEL